MKIKDIEIIKNIGLCWKYLKYDVCESCMYEDIRHYDRNMESDSDDYISDEGDLRNINVGCNEQDSPRHLDKYDGNTFAYAGGYIRALLHVINKLVDGS